MRNLRLRFGWAVGLRALACSPLAVAWLAGCSADGSGNAAERCTPGASLACACPGGAPLTTSCRADGSGYQPCACGAANSAGGNMAAAGSPAAASGAPQPEALPVGGRAAPSTSGAAGMRAPTGAGGLAGRAAAGAPDMAAAGSGIGGAVGAAGGGSSTDLEQWRQLCVDEINMYRATLPSLKPFKRGNAMQEACSDRGAQSDGDSMQAHGFARMDSAANLVTCRNKPTRGLLGGENTCPGWPVGGKGGGSYASVVDAVKSCLKSMWAEGEPPGGRAACTDACYEAHGHYINMTDPGASSVSCSFYKMNDGKSWWMNQDFSSF
jgi:hypothetical protein